MHNCSLLRCRLLHNFIPRPWVACPHCHTGPLAYLHVWSVGVIACHCQVLWPCNPQRHPHRTVHEQLPASLLDHLSVFIFFSSIFRGPCNNWHHLGHVEQVNNDDDALITACGWSQVRSTLLPGHVTLWHPHRTTGEPLSVYWLTRLCPVSHWVGGANPSTLALWPW